MSVFLLSFQTVADASDASSPLRSSFAHEHAVTLWQDCCLAAKQCCQKIKTTDLSSGRRQAPPA